MSYERGHQSVLLQESIAALLTKSDGLYVDATFGRGGHSNSLYEKSGKKALIIAIDRDQAAIEFGEPMVKSGVLHMLIKAPFSRIKEELNQRDINGVTGVLMDIGVSSPQFDTPERGFSFRYDAPLDMRMDQQSAVTAADWVNSADVSQMARAFRTLGEEPNALRIAKAIARTRQEKRITTTKELAALISNAVRASKSKIHPATKVFQAIRMTVNDELGELQRGLEQAWSLLEAGGRLAVISFHSLEDRMVKRFMRSLIQPDQGDRPWAAEPLEPKAISICFPLKPSEEEVSQNPRSRSARLRVVEKI